MKRYFKDIFLALFFVLWAVSCVEELEAPQSVIETDSETILVPRVTGFANQYITRSNSYSSDEAKITRLSILVFNSDGNLLRIQESQNSDPITLNKSMLNSPEQKEKLREATVVMIANLSLVDLKDSSGQSVKVNDTLTLAGMEKYTCHLKESQTVITNTSATDFEGFPMIGSKTVDLIATTDQQEPQVVNLKILYAKINFSISVAEGTENEDVGPGISFQLKGYSVHNVSMATTLAIPGNKGEPMYDFLGNEKTGVVAESDDATASSSYAYTSTGASGAKTGTIALKSDPKESLTFTFYVSESRYNPSSNLSGIYPSDDWLTIVPDEDVENYDESKESERNGVWHYYDDLIQQYKPKLATADGGLPGIGLATYVLIDGTYTDYRGTVWDVKYKVYLGKDNAQNFHVDRNSQYFNYITIKGIRNNDSYYETDDNGNVIDENVWIDHRVNVSYGDQPDGQGTADDCVTITRETLIDSHIEVRPLRVKWNEGEYEFAKLYLPTNENGTLVNWIGIERFTGGNNQDGSIYCYNKNGQSTGKRKYFTTSLISDLQTKTGDFGVQTDDNGKKHIILFNGESAWIYFDENSGSARTADIKLEFVSDEGTSVVEVYNVKQRALLSVGGYQIESYEEYLHSYDSEDKYDLSTGPADYTQQGLEWGLAQRKISENVVVSASGLSPLLDYKDYRYDFYHKSDGSYSLYTDSSGSWAQTAFGSGLEFTDHASTLEGITIIDMGTIPNNAYQYCLSKNKFKEDADGKHTMDIHWYLPDVYEMSDILSESQSGTTPVDINPNSYYWSSQPSMTDVSYTVLNTYNLMDEVPDSARVVSIYNGMKNDLRTSKNRIRCVYSSEGILGVDMSERVPDGIGGNHSFYMKAYNGANDGYFRYMVPTIQPIKDTTVNVNDEFGYEKDTYPYPTKNNHENFDYYVVTKDNQEQVVEGFRVDPQNREYWGRTTYYGSTYYELLHYYPGLSQKVLSKFYRDDVYKEESDDKTKTETITETKTINLDNKLPSYVGLEPLDRSTNRRFNISFSSNGSPDPQFVYDEEQQTTTVNTWNWIRPQYDTTNYTPASGKDILTVTDIDGDSNVSGYGENSKKEAFKAAYETAIAEAKEKILSDLESRNQEDPGWEIDGNIDEDIDYTPLYWDSDEPDVVYGGYNGLFIKYTTCTVTIDASVPIKKAATEQTVYIQKSGTGCWSDENPGSPQNTGEGRTLDEMRIYCGNSFTISLSDEARNAGYEITKVKVYYSGSNSISSSWNSYIYARFVDSLIAPTPDEPVEGDGTTHLMGMEYNDNGDTPTQEWSGNGRQELTLVLVDYNVTANNFWDLVFGRYNYTYTIAKKNLNKYLVVDRIDVKCVQNSTSSTTSLN